jgi:hypothetical protein
MRKIWLIIGLTFFTGIINARRPASYLHEGGLSVFSGLSDYASTAGFGFVYAPQLIFKEYNRIQSLGIASYLMIGKSMMVKDYLPATKINPIDYEIPLYIQYNYGYGATKHKTSRDYGLYAAAGYTYSSLIFAPIDMFGLPGEFKRSYGPSFLFGFRYKSGFGANIYLVSPSNKLTIVGIRALVNLNG